MQPVMHLNTNHSHAACPVFWKTISMTEGSLPTGAALKLNSTIARVGKSFLTVHKNALYIGIAF